jgi:hypothetical protein
MAATINCLCSYCGKRAAVGAAKRQHRAVLSLRDGSLQVVNQLDIVLQDLLGGEVPAPFVQAKGWCVREHLGRLGRCRVRIFLGQLGSHSATEWMDGWAVGVLAIRDCLGANAIGNGNTKGRTNENESGLGT